MMVWFWGINLWVFAQANVNYAKIFDLDQNHLSHREIWKVTYTCHELIVLQLNASLTNSFSLKCCGADAFILRWLS